MKPWLENQLQKKYRIYILPTKMGGYLNGLIFLMFLLSVGYGNNLLLIFTLFLFGLNLMWVVQTHFHLNRLQFQNITLTSGHALAPLALSIRWKKQPEEPWRWNFYLRGKKGILPVVGQDEGDLTVGEVSLPYRGCWNWDYLKVTTTRPFGLYQAWYYVKIEAKQFAYPPLLKDIQHPPPTESQLEGEIPVSQKGHDDLQELSPYQGQEARRISWKHYAKSGELFVKEGSELKTTQVELRLRLPEDASKKERYLSELATQMVNCHYQEIPFIFHGLKNQRGPSFHTLHLHECLKELADV